MAKRNKSKIASKSRKSALRIESLEQRQLLATITGGGTEVGSNIVHPNTNVYDQVLMTGSSVTVTADAGQVTRISFLDLQGDIVQAEFSGKGSLTISLDQFSTAAAPTNYNQPDVQYVKGLATFTIQGADATTNFSTFSVGSANAVNQALFTGGKTGGNNTADVARLLIVSDPTNPGGFSNFGSILAGNAVFSDGSGTVGISANNVSVQGTVRIGDIDARNAGVPSLIFGSNSQFGTIQVSGGDLVQTNALVINGNGFTNVNSIAGTTSAGATLSAQIVTGGNIDTSSGTAGTQAATVVTLDETTTYDLTGKSQAQITAFFNGRTFTNAITISGDLTGVGEIKAAEFRGGATFTGAIEGDITVEGAAGNVTFSKGLVAGADFKAGTVGTVTLGGDLAGTVRAKSIGGVAVTGNVSGTISSDYSDNGFTTNVDKAIGNVSITGNLTGKIEGMLGIGNVSVDGNVTTATGYVLRTASGTTGDEAVGNIGTVTVKGDVNVGAGVELIEIAASGVYGNITVSGGGSLGDTTTGPNFGNIAITTSLGSASAKAGNISITETVDVVVGTITAGGTLGSLGDLTVKSGGTASTDITLDTINLGTGVSFGKIDLSGARTISTAAISAKTIGDIVINAGATNTVNINNAISAADNVATGIGSIGAITITGVTTIKDDIKASTIGAITLNNTTTFEADDGFFAKKTFTSLTANGDVTFGDGLAIQVGGTTGAFTFNGTTTFGNGGTVGTIAADNDTSALDKIGSLVFNGRVVGGAGTEVRASSVGDITVKAVLNQNQALVTDFTVDVRNNFSAADGTSEETVNRNGSDVGNYSIGNITVQSTNTIGVSGTSLFSGSNSFMALGKIGDVSFLGGGSASLQSSLFAAATSGVAVVVGDGDGDFTNFGTGAQVNFNGDVDFADTGENAADFNGNTTVSIGKVTINASGPGDDLINAGGNAGGTNGLIVLSGVEGLTSANFPAAANDTILLGATDAQLRGTVGEISIGSLSQLLAISNIAAIDNTNNVTGNFNALENQQNAGVIAASNGFGDASISPFTKVQGVTTNFDTDSDSLLLAGTSATDADANSIIIVRL